MRTLAKKATAMTNATVTTKVMTGRSVMNNAINVTIPGSPWRKQSDNTAVSS